MHAVHIHADGRPSHTHDLRDVRDVLNFAGSVLNAHNRVAQVPCTRTNEFLLLVDEEGKQRGLTANVEASILAEKEVFGDALLVRHHLLRGSIEVRELTPDEADEELRAREDAFHRSGTRTVNC
jgi:hypothetical protein